VLGTAYIEFSKAFLGFENLVTLDNIERVEK